MIKLLLFVYRFVPQKTQLRILNIITRFEGGEMYSKTLRKVFKDKYNVEIGYGSYGGCFNIDNAIPANVTFGNWCSISRSIRIFRANHPKNTFTTHPLLYNPVAGYVHGDKLNRPSLNIGHDVWIGEWVTILPRVTSIGNGAIIGAGCVVTKDVAPYSIVVGNPAKEVGKRFNPSVIQKLEKTRWWLMTKGELISYIDELNLIISTNSQNEMVKSNETDDFDINNVDAE